tara:strand:+ start:12490 stop:12672 length:183 start_codon:yes stop_codon:yes gene_type:complete
MFRAALNLFARWGITDEQAAVLTDMPVRSLAHVESNDVRRAYLRGEHWNERVKMMQYWSD